MIPLLLGPLAGPVRATDPRAVCPEPLDAAGEPPGGPA
jgi:hypothetical protein